MTSSVARPPLPVNNRTFSCPLQGQWSSFQLVNEAGDGEPYAGLAFEVTDTEGRKYAGRLDASGTGKVADHFAGPIALQLDHPYQGRDEVYADLITRRSYPLPITDLQVRAEGTRFTSSEGNRTRTNPAQARADSFYQVEVRHLVSKTSHLPTEVACHYPMLKGARQLMGAHGSKGVVLLSCRHNVLEVRPLRALRPMLSTGAEFCALNLYQLAVMATLSYCPFGQSPETQPVRTSSVNYPHEPSVGNLMGDALSSFQERWKVDRSQTSPYYPLYEDVPYSTRFEIVPFDPVLYPDNDPAHGEDQLNPAKVHFFDDRTKTDSTDTQAFITHNQNLILISIRGTNELLNDGLRDADALQVPFEGTDANVHRGFYAAANAVLKFVAGYLEQFYNNQTLIICGHSLGGANALLLAEMLRRGPEGYNVVLYTYGAPRAGDARFVQQAEALTHYRMVNHNDPVPSVPATWMNTRPTVYATGAALTFLNVPLGLGAFAAGITNLSGEPYEHHGTLRHFMPVFFDAKQKSSILWEPGCDTVAQHAACSEMVNQSKGLPKRSSFLKQILDGGDHSMTGSYIPHCWMTLRRWQEAQTLSRGLITAREYTVIDDALASIINQLRQKKREIYGRPEAYARAHEDSVQALSREVDKVAMTRARLETLRFQRISLADVYGDYAHRPEVLTEGLGRWTRHAENTLQHQLAMAPPIGSEKDQFGSPHEYVVGAPHSLDLDLIG